MKEESVRVRIEKLGKKDTKTRRGKWRRKQETSVGKRGKREFLLTVQNNDL